MLIGLPFLWLLAKSYYTSKTFEWVDKLDLRDAPNRRVQRAIEKKIKLSKRQPSEKEMKQLGLVMCCGLEFLSSYDLS